MALPALAQPPGPVPGTDPPLTFPDVKPLEPEVATLLNAQQGKLSEQLQNPEASLRQITSAFGELGKLYHAHNLLGPAEACYRNAARLTPSDYRWPHYLGALLKESGRLDEALQALGKALSLQSNDAPALVYQAEVFRVQGKTSEAEAALRRALEVQPALTAAKALLGQTALDRKDFAAAVPLLEAALAEAPEANRLHYMLGTAYRGLGNASKAQEHLAKAGQVGVAPADPLLAEIQTLRAGERLALTRGKTAYDRGRFAEAAEEFRKALSSKPDSLEARINLAASLVQLGDRPAALVQFREVVRLAPDNATARFNLGSLLASEGPSAEAIEHLTAAARLRPEDAEARRLLARTLRDAGRLEEALAQYAQAVQAQPADEASWMGQAETLVRLERYREAMARLEDGLRMLPSSALLGRGLVRLLSACPDLTLRDGARALTIAQALWQAQPTLDHAELQALAHAELGRCDDAARWQRSALDAARQAGLDQRVPSLAAALDRYQRGSPCQP